MSLFQKIWKLTSLGESTKFSQLVRTLLILPLLFILSPIPGCGGGSQGTGGVTINGELRLATSMQVLPGVTVTVDETGESAITDDQGLFTIDTDFSGGDLLLRFNDMKGIDTSLTINNVPSSAAVTLALEYEAATNTIRSKQTDIKERKKKKKKKKDPAPDPDDTGSGEIPVAPPVAPVPEQNTPTPVPDDRTPQATATPRKEPEQPRQPREPEATATPQPVPATPTPTATPCVLEGDADHNGVVNSADNDYITAHWGESGPEGDVNHDGTVDIFDINYVSSNFGKHC